MWDMVRAAVPACLRMGRDARNEFPHTLSPKVGAEIFCQLLVVRYELDPTAAGILRDQLHDDLGVDFMLCDFCPRHRFITTAQLRIVLIGRVSEHPALAEALH